MKGYMVPLHERMAKLESSRQPAFDAVCATR